MLRSMMTVSGFTLMSRILGFLRDILIARFVGTGPVADAFVAAFRFPNMFRRVFGEGAYNAAFVPLFGRKLEEDGKEAAVGFARNTFSTLLWVLGLLMLIAIPCMHWLMLVMVPGFLAKFEGELKDPGTEALVYEVVVDTKGATDLYFAVASEDDEAIEKWTERLRLQEAVFLEGREQKEVSLQIGDLKKPEGVSPVEGAEGVLQLTSGLAKLPLPDDHQYHELRLQVAVQPGEELPPGTIEAYRNHPDNFELTVALSRIMFCYLFFMALVAHLSGILNTFKRFAVPAAAPIILNVVMLAALGTIWFMQFEGDLQVGRTLAWGVALAGLLQCVVVWIACARAQAAMTPSLPIWNPELKRLLLLMGPGVLAAGIQQVNLIVGSIIASFQQGAISFLYYSDRVYQLPLGMIGIALGVVLLPEVTRFLRSGQEDRAAGSILKGLELGMLLTIPAAVAMLVIHQPIISVLFERGKFDAHDVEQTGWALAGFALGLPGYVLIKVFQPAYFARENTKAPMAMAGVAVAVNIVCSVILFNLLRPTGFGPVGIAIATAISAWVNVFLLWRGMDGFVVISREVWRKLGGMVAASVIMGVLIWIGARLLEPWFDGLQWQRIVALALVIGLGLTAYALSALFLRVTSVSELKASFRRT